MNLLPEKPEADAISTRSRKFLCDKRARATDKAFVKMIVDDRATNSSDRRGMGEKKVE
jgi:hypothetical protein